MYYLTLGLHFGDSVSRSMGVLDMKRSLLWSVAKFRLPSKHVLTICHWNLCSHNTFALCLVIWHVYVVVVVSVTQRLACVNQGCHKSRCEGDVELSGRIGLETFISFILAWTSFFLYCRNLPYHCCFSLALLSSFQSLWWRGGGGRSVAQLISTFLPSCVLCVGHW